jgi:hypothetical protein
VGLAQGVLAETIRTFCQNYLGPAPSGAGNPSLHWLHILSIPDTTRFLATLFACQSYYNFLFY